MIYDYVQTKPPMEDIIEHGWAKDAAAKVHKYLERWRGKNGKWVYRYYRAKSKGQEKLAKVKRFFKGAWNASDEIAKDGTVRRTGLRKAKKSAYERRTATRVSGKSKGKYISSASGGQTKKEMTTDQSWHGNKKSKSKLVSNPRKEALRSSGKHKGKYISSAGGGVTKKEIKTTPVGVKNSTKKKNRTLSLSQRGYSSSRGGGGNTKKNITTTKVGKRLSKNWGLSGSYSNTKNLYEKRLKNMENWKTKKKTKYTKKKVGPFTYTTSSYYY